jgi:hypothetical protein
MNNLRFGKEYLTNLDDNFETMKKDIPTTASDLIMKASLIAEEIRIEEGKFKEAAHNKTAEEIEAIRDKLSFLKRKHSLFIQAAKMKESKG